MSNANRLRRPPRLAALVAIPLMLVLRLLAHALPTPGRRKLLVSGGASDAGGLARLRVVRGMRQRSVLSISGENIGFRVMSEACWPFSDLESVDVRRTLVGASVIFLRSGRRGVFAADVPDMAAARRVLAALPPGVPLARNASILARGMQDESGIRLGRFRGTGA
jgi:hypothetical protein